MTYVTALLHFHTARSKRSMKYMDLFDLSPAATLRSRPRSSDKNVFSLDAARLFSGLR